ncbi:MAG: outer membrane beta-barrel domain-containing protein, partial [Pseudobdellovibrionaceae bacterium]
MKTMSLIPALFLAVVIGLSVTANAQNKKAKINFSQDMDTLGGNEALVGKATALDPQNKTRIVQSRLVDRNYRFEFGGNFGGVAGGDSYLKTLNYGVSADFHFNPRWSLGVRDYDY